MNHLLAAVLLLVGSGVASLLVGVKPRWSSTIGVLGVLGAAVLGVPVAWQALHGAKPLEVALGLPLAFGEPVVGIDALSAFFLLPLLLLASLAGVYGPSYLAAHGAKSARAVANCSFNLLVASMVIVLIARDSMLFLVAWEVMTLSSYLLVCHDHRLAEVRRAGFVYLIAGHVGVAALMALFVLLGAHGQTSSFSVLRAMSPPSFGFATVIVVLALMGFGVKAGVVPLHVWLPEAHAAAPSHVSALMSGIMVKLGLYGMLRVFTLVAPGGFLAPLLMILGLSGALFGIAQAMYQTDLKRVLAYSTVENVGVILIGLGLGYWGLTTGSSHLALLGFFGAMFHLWSHVAMKGLMFLGAGSVLHGSGTRNLERLGGLIKRMPVTGVVFLLGGVALSALPPCAGFVGEWLIYLGLVDAGTAQPGAMGVVLLLSIGVLALVGSIVALCFVRLLGVTLLGNARSDDAASAEESSAWMTVPMCLLALLVVSLAVRPLWVLSPITEVARVLGVTVAPSDLQGITSSLSTLGTVNVYVWLAIAVVAAVLVPLLRRTKKQPTWDCGYAAPCPRAQYSAGAFSEYATVRLLPRKLGPVYARFGFPLSLFPDAAGIAVGRSDPLTRSVYEPFLARWAERLVRLRWIQQGILHLYVLYIFGAVMLTLFWAAISGWSGK